ncbi:MAG: hypothetical protein HYX35_06750 [Proteobacteria bacterium]|nr:hypothetical protein [Pseudomonadota bacterium]
MKKSFLFAFLLGAGFFSSLSYAVILPNYPIEDSDEASPRFRTMPMKDRISRMAEKAQRNIDHECSLYIKYYDKFGDYYGGSASLAYDLLLPHVFQAIENVICGDDQADVVMKPAFRKRIKDLHQYKWYTPWVINEMLRQNPNRWNVFHLPFESNYQGGNLFPGETPQASFLRLRDEWVNIAISQHNQMTYRYSDPDQAPSCPDPLLNEHTLFSVLAIPNNWGYPSREWVKSQETWTTKSLDEELIFTLPRLQIPYMLDDWGKSLSRDLLIEVSEEQAKIMAFRFNELLLNLALDYRILAMQKKPTGVVGQYLKTIRMMPPTYLLADIPFDYRNEVFVISEFAFKPEFFRDLPTTIAPSSGQHSSDTNAQRAGQSSVQAIPSSKSTKGRPQAHIRTQETEEIKHVEKSFIEVAQQVEKAFAELAKKLGEFVDALRK